jgi:hypothetical protein
MRDSDRKICIKHRIRYLYYCPECTPEYVPVVSTFEYDIDSKPTTYLLGRIAREHDIEIELVHCVYDYCRVHDISVALVLRRIKNDKLDGEM